MMIFDNKIYELNNNNNDLSEIVNNQKNNKYFKYSYRNNE